MTPTPTLPARVPAAHCSAAPCGPSVGRVAWLLLCLSAPLTGCVGERFEGEESADSSGNLAVASSGLPTASAAAPVASPSLSAVSAASSAATSAAPAGSTAPATSSSAPTLDAGSSPQESGEDASPSCPAWGCPLNECPEISDVLSPYGVCYFIGDSASWADARTACTDHGAGWTLLTIRSEEEHLFASSELLSTTTWLGASDQQMPDHWTWVGDDSPFFIGMGTGMGIGMGMGMQGTAQDGAFIQWSEGEPSNLIGDEQCARYEEDRDGVWGWGDFYCNRLFEFICELRGD